MGFYAVKRMASVAAMGPGDRIILYRSRGTTKREGPGVVGAFEVLEAPREPSRSNRNLFLSLYPVIVPWKAIAVSVETPLPIAPLVPQLNMFPGKQRYGSALQTTLKRLTKSDYDILETALKKHVKEEHTARTSV